MIPHTRCDILDVWSEEATLFGVFLVLLVGRWERGSGYVSDVQQIGIRNSISFALQPEPGNSITTISVRTTIPIVLLYYERTVLVVVIVFLPALATLKDSSNPDLETGSY